MLCNQLKQLEVPRDENYRNLIIRMSHGVKEVMDQYPTEQYLLQNVIEEFFLKKIVCCC